VLWPFWPSGALLTIGGKGRVNICLKRYNYCGAFSALEYEIHFLYIYIIIFQREAPLARPIGCLSVLIIMHIMMNRFSL